MDDYIGCNIVMMGDIENNKYEKPFWMPFYGDYKDKKADENLDNELGTRYKGSLLVSILMIQVKEHSLNKEDVGVIPKLPEPRSYTLLVDIQFAFNIKGSNSSQYICLNWYNQSQKSLRLKN